MSELERVEDPVSRAFRAYIRGGPDPAPVFAADADRARARLHDPNWYATIGGRRLKVEEKVRTEKRRVLTLGLGDLIALLKSQGGDFKLGRSAPSVISLHRFIPGGPNVGDGKGRDHVSEVAEVAINLRPGDELRFTVDEE